MLPTPRGVTTQSTHWPEEFDVVAENSCQAQSSNAHAHGERVAEDGILRYLLESPNFLQRPKGTSYA
jgi:hypothetical protein